MAEDSNNPNSKNICICGCGEEIPFLSKHRREPARFKHGHNQSRERHWQWKGGIVMHSNGYRMIMVKGHPRANHLGYVQEHTLVMEKILGRYLERHEEVHHKNEIRTDNRPENLQLVTHSEHVTLHHKGKKKIRRKAAP